MCSTILSSRKRERSVSLLSSRKEDLWQYTVDFHNVVEEAGWDELGLGGMFTKSLSENIRNHLASRDESNSLNNNRLKDYNSQPLRPSVFRPVEEVTRPTNHSHILNPEPEPIQMGCERLTPEERQRRFNLSKVPSVFHILATVFSKQKSPHSHQPYDLLLNSSQVLPYLLVVSTTSLVLKERL